MAKIDVHSLKGEKQGTMELDPSVFNAETSESAVHQVVVALRANARGPFAHSKTRGFVRGGGRKPWRQKGTGNARAGSIRSPIWRGGGIVFGPAKNRDFSKKVPRTLFRKSLISVLSDRSRDKALFLIDKLDHNEIKTKTLVGKIFDLKKSLGIKDEKLVIIVNTLNKALAQSARNLTKVSIVSVANANPLNLLFGKTLVVEKEAAIALEKRLAKKSTI